MKFFGGAKHIAQHGAEKFPPFIGAQHGRQALFGAGQILDWNDRPHQRSAKPVRQEICLLFVKAYRPCRMVQAIK